MINNVYAVYDDAARLYTLPMCFSNDEMAMRNFEASIMSDTSTMGTHPHQFRLVRLGTYDDETAMFAQDTQVMVVLTGQEATTRLGQNRFMFEESPPVEGAVKEKATNGSQEKTPE